MKFPKMNSRVVLGMLVAAMIGGMTAPAFADRDEDHHDHDRGHQNDRHDVRYQRDDHYDRHDERRGDRRWDESGHAYYYQQPVYVPPTVYVAPQQSPGVNLFVPLNFHL